MNVVDRWTKDINVIRMSVAVNLVSKCIVYLFVAIVASNVVLLLNHLFVGVDLCGLFLPVYETLGFPLLQRGMGSKINNPFFCCFEVATRPIFFLYAALFCLLAMLLFVANVFDGWRKSLQILGFFMIIGIAGIVFPYSELLYRSFYGGPLLISLIKFVGECLLVPLVYVAFSFAFRTGNHFIVRG